MFNVSYTVADRNDSTIPSSTIFSKRGVLYLYQGITSTNNGIAIVVGENGVTDVQGTEITNGYPGYSSDIVLYYAGFDVDFRISKS